MATQILNDDLVVSLYERTGFSLSAVVNQLTEMGITNPYTLKPFSRQAIYNALRRNARGAKLLKEKRDRALRVRKAQEALLRDGRHSTTLPK